MTESSQKKQAWVTSLKLLGVSPKSRAQLAAKLTERGFEGWLIRDVLDELEEKGVLSDKGFASDLMNRFTQDKPSGRRKIEFELRRRGIPNKIRDEVLSGLDQEGERDRALQIGLSRWERLKKLAPDKRRKRLLDFLGRRGFEFQVCMDIVREIERQQSAENDEW